jgi:hypothetical protein
MAQVVAGGGDAGRGQRPRLQFLRDLFELVTLDDVADLIFAEVA